MSRKIPCFRVIYRHKLDVLTTENLCGRHDGISNPPVTGKVPRMVHTSIERFRDDLIGIHSPSCDPLDSLFTPAPEGFVACCEK